jgi:hypothetical protein
MAAANSTPKFDSTKVEIKPNCYPLAERGNIVEEYHGIKVCFKINLQTCKLNTSLY